MTTAQVATDVPISTYPRKGTETARSSYRADQAKISTYPRKGTETLFYKDCQTCRLDFNLSPQGDGNIFPLSLIETLTDFNLSPQGDGNFDLDDFLTVAVTFQLIPARGRKPNQIVLSRQALAISTYPRKNPLRRCAPALPKGELL